MRVYHGGRDVGQQARDQALAAAGARVHLVIPRHWPAAGQQEPAAVEPTAAVSDACGIEVIEVEVSRAGDVNRHRHQETAKLAALLRHLKPDILDVHEEPVSVAMHQLLSIAPAGVPVVGYTAQNLDKRFPPPFAQYERSALARLGGLYPCSRQAASVAWGKGFRGHLQVLPLGYDATVFAAGNQRSSLAKPLLVLAGRLVPEKGIRDAVAVLAAIRRRLPARLVLVGSGAELDAAKSAAVAAGVGGAVTHRPWLGPTELAEVYRQAHIVLAPSRSTTRWVEQFGRVVTEAQASGAVVCGYSTGALPEVGGAAAVLVADGATGEMADRIHQILSDQTAWTQRSTLGLASAATRTWPAIAQAQLAFYEEVMRQPRPGRLGAPDNASRREALYRYGPPAVAGDVPRPFAVPVLRDLGAAQVKLGQAVDAVTGAGRRTVQRLRARVSDR
ncbi:MAG: glycosyltransferase [Actinomycetota bacterium]|nr:glycosyltransferase [Actinomycetota bacterium]